MLLEKCINYNIGIYKILNLITHKIYIGSTISFKERRKNHFKLLRNNKHVNIYLQRAFNKYNKENFIFHVIEYCNEEDLLNREQYWLDFYNSFNRDFGYNINPRADRSIMSEETKEKIRLSKIGKKLTEEHKKKISESNKGKKYSEYTKLKISNSLKGKIKTKETCDKIKKSLTGRIISEEWRNKISLSTTGNKNHFFGKKHSEKTKKLISNTRIKKQVSKFDLENKYIKTYESIRLASLDVNVDDICISRCCRKPNRYKTAGGYKWKFYEVSI